MSVGLVGDRGGSKSTGHCMLNDERLWVDMVESLVASGIGKGGMLSDDVLEDDKLGGLVPRWDEMDDDLVLRAESVNDPSDPVLALDRGLKKLTVLARRSICFSIFSSSSATFFGSGSLFSNFPFLSDAKYSSPRPKTT